MTVIGLCCSCGHRVNAVSFGAANMALSAHIIYANDPSHVLSAPKQANG